MSLTNNRKQQQQHKDDDFYLEEIIKNIYNTFHFKTKL